MIIAVITIFSEEKMKEDRTCVKNSLKCGLICISVLSLSLKDVSRVEKRKCVSVGEHMTQDALTFLWTFYQHDTTTSCAATCV